MIILCPTGAIAVTSSLFTERNSPHLLGVHCSGNESSLLECSYSSDIVCGRQEDAAVVCQGLYVHVCESMWGE